MAMAMSRVGSVCAAEQGHHFRRVTLHGKCGFGSGRFKRKSPAACCGASFFVWRCASIVGVDVAVFGLWQEQKADDEGDQCDHDRVPEAGEDIAG